MNYKYKYTYLVIPTEGKKFFGKVYFGQHVTNDLNDGYICSSSLISKWCKKHPNGYYREIIAFYDTQEELNEAEYNLIHPHLNKPYCLNLRDGGNYGNMSEDARKRQSNTRKEKFANGELTVWNKGLTGLHYNIREDLSERHSGENNPFYGKHHKQKTKDRIGKTRSETYWKLTPEERKAEYDSRRGKKQSKESNEKRSKKLKGRVSPNKGNKGYKHTEISKQHYREAWVRRKNKVA